MVSYPINVTLICYVVRIQAKIVMVELSFVKIDNFQTISKNVFLVWKLSELLAYKLRDRFMQNFPDVNNTFTERFYWNELNSIRYKAGVGC